MAQVRGKGWSHRQIRALQKASDMSPYIISAIRVWVPAFRCWHHTSTICHDFKMLGQAKGMRANNGRQSTPWFKCHLQEVTVCDVIWTRPDFSPMPRNWLIFHRKMRSIHKTGQRNLWKSNSNHPKANQSQNTSHSIVAGAHRKQWGHILEDQQRRNVGKLHGSVRKGPPPHLATWKPEPRGYSCSDHGTFDITMVWWMQTSQLHLVSWLSNVGASADVEILETLKQAARAEY